MQSQSQHIFFNSSRAGTVLNPALDKVCAVKTTFQGLMVDIPGYGLIPWFEGCIQSLSNYSQRSAVYRAKRAVGDTHILIDRWWAYRELSYTYPINSGIGIDYAASPYAFADLVGEAQSEGFYTQIMLANEGQHRVDGQYGYYDGLNSLPLTIAALRDLIPCSIFFHGYELMGPGGDWTSEQIEYAYVFLRSLLGSVGKIGLELGQGYCKWREGPNGETGWETEAGKTINVFCQEFPQEIDDPTVDDRGGTKFGGCQQVAARMLGPKKRNIEPKNDGPWYLAGLDTRVIGFEYGLYQFVRDRDVEKVNRRREMIKSLGYDYVS
jgi:hypothetical protein